MIQCFSVRAALFTLVLSAPAGAETAQPALGPSIAETRTYRIQQTVELRDVPATAKNVQLWVPVPADGSWQRVLDRRVVEAPPGWKLTHEPTSDADLVYVETPRADVVKVVVETTVMRSSPVFDLARPAPTAVEKRLFVDELCTDAPLMTADEAVSSMARKACAGETDPVRKAVLILHAVADAADHYSKDSTKPKCGRGSAQDCLAHGGGCCTDLHSLFIAAAREQGIPARLEYGYRLNPAKEGTSFDPGYRCWVEYNLPGMGWVPTDIVVADAGERVARDANFGTLDARRVWLWQGRGLNLAPRQQSSPIQTMISGWAEIDGVAVDVLPAADGTPSKLQRTINFTDLTPKPATVTN